MTLSKEAFVGGITSLNEILPFGKEMSVDALSLLWMTFPVKAREELTTEVWLYAIGQRLLDPNPNKERTITQQLLSYVYRNKDGAPCTEWGLKEDLQTRILRADRFNPPGPLPPAENAPGGALPGS